MMKLSVDLKVKFRAFGITFGQLSEHFDLPLPQIPVPVPAQTLLNFDQRGVKLFIKLQAA